MEKCWFVFVKKLLFPVTILNFLHSGVWIRQIYKVDSGIILSDSNFSILKCHCIKDVFFHICGDAIVYKYGLFFQALDTSYRDIAVS